MDKGNVAILNGKILGKDLKEFDISTSLSTAKLIGIYFSAHWCPPCRGFTPQLVNFYNEVNKNEKEFEVIFASCDQDEKSFASYFSEMPWLTLPFKDSRCDAASDEYGCEGIPYLVVLTKEGIVVTKNGRGDVMQKGAAAFQKW